MKIVLQALGALLALALGVWNFFKRKNRDKRKRADESQKQFEKGMKDEDPSKITSSFDRIRRDS